MPGTCNDCGAGFTGDVKAHVAAAHPGLPRFRFRDSKGVNHLICADCGLDVEEGGPKHLAPTGRHASGSPSDDPKDLFANHQLMHKGEA